MSAPAISSETSASSAPAVVWKASEGQDVPPSLKAVGVRRFDPSKTDDHRLLICFAPVKVDRLDANIAEIRKDIGAEAYLIAVPDRPLSKAWITRTIDSGADDVLDLGEEANIALSLARAKQAFRAHYSTAEKCVEERDFLQDSIDNLPSPIFYKNRAGLYIGCNKAFEAFIGLPREEIIGSSVYDVAPANLARVYEEADEALMREGAIQVYEADVRYADGSIHTVCFHKAAIKDKKGKTIGLAGAMLDISDRKSLEKQLIIAAERDPLTNCYNRRKFFEVADTLIAEAKQTHQPLCVAVADVDHFKPINDRLGHANGDLVLREIATRLQKQCGEDNLMARVGGEEFYFVYPACSRAGIEAAAEHLRAAIANHPIEVEGTTVNATISLGVTHLDPCHETVADALKRADRALYKAKSEGRNRVCVAR